MYMYQYVQLHVCRVVLNPPPPPPPCSLDLDKWIYEPPPESDNEFKDELGFLLEPSSTRGTMGGDKNPTSKGKRRKRNKEEKEEEQEMEKVC